MKVVLESSWVPQPQIKANAGITFQSTVYTCSKRSDTKGSFSLQSPNVKQGWTCISYINILDIAEFL